jgi:hypothetical protein
MISPAVEIPPYIKTKAHQSLERVTRRAEGQTGLKFCDGFIEAKIKGANGVGDIRFVRSNIFTNPNKQHLIILDKMTNHAGLERLTREGKITYHNVGSHEEHTTCAKNETRIG